MKEGNTTLSVPKELAEHLRQDIDGRNDYERLHNWAEKEYGQSNNKDITLEEIKELLEQNSESNNNSITLTEIKSAVEDALEENLADQALGRY